ncbi:amino acid ABC transporter substrate-binding protein [Roseateles sp.]|uniref:amino acid ABC transporter substrate-binding protein n=1 Tax=Roseateles sp. TaxID=1971397 RepID=UPI003D0F1F38
MTTQRPHPARPQPRKTWPLLISAATAAIASGLTAPAQAGNGTLDSIRSSGELVIGYRADAIPFSYDLPGAKQPVGYAIEICKQLAEGMKKELKLKELSLRYKAVDSKQRFPAVAEGQVDLECANTTNNRERRDKLGMAFTIPHYIAGTRMLVRKDSNIERVEDLGGKRVITTKGTTSAPLIKAKAQDLSLSIKLLECDDDQQCFNAVDKRQADAYLMDDILLYSFRASAPKPDEFAVVGKLLSIEPLSIMMSKKDAALKKFVDVEMARLVRSGEVAKLYKQWFEAPIPPKNMNLNVPMNYLTRDSFKFPTDQVGD